MWSGSRRGPGSVWSGWRIACEAAGVADHPRAFQTRCTTAEVRVPEGTAFNVDGEVVNVGNARFTAQERAFQLVIG